MELGLQDKVVIVTGGSSNIGRATVLAFAREKSRVVIADIDQNAGEAVAKEANNLGGQAVLVKTDVTRADDTQTLADRAVQQFGRIDVLVNCVGWDKLTPFLETNPEMWAKLINLNFLGVLNCTKAVLPQMVQRNSGVVVSVASDAGRVGEAQEAVYGGCKAAVMAFSKSVAKEVGRNGIRLNVICPGFTPGAPERVGSNSMWTGRDIPQERKDKIAAIYPLKRHGKPEDIANAAVFLASDAASFITGQVLSVSGGYTMV